MTQTILKSITMNIQDVAVPLPALVNTLAQGLYFTIQPYLKVKDKVQMYLYIKIEKF